MPGAAITLQAFAYYYPHGKKCNCKRVKRSLLTRGVIAQHMEDVIICFELNFFTTKEEEVYTQCVGSYIFEIIFCIESLKPVLGYIRFTFTLFARSAIMVCILMQCFLVQKPLMTKNDLSSKTRNI
uniref:Uncharacterized protein n=1 Tax=Glossina palpalis gambiensis TaxID=67801 RepID=A0A1B0ASF3_9MUSC